MDPKDPAAVSWHLDKRIPLTLIFAMIVQTVWIANALTTRGIQIDNHEQRLNRAEITSQKFEDTVNEFVRRAAQRQVTLEEHAAKLAKLEATDTLIASNISAIFSQLSRIDERTSQLSNVIIDLRNESRRTNQSQQQQQHQNYRSPSPPDGRQ